ncbi:MAG: Unknown protein [uncultured Sulfurovum sp.]|uniref:Uncharacterized protein n=1 Tax=uncultured Sulfurovum sp. TaxID=269237 RepID=A0A6S6T8K8_9BACT|nr:MAG: Unknown protein [uncultured Sulfurovum sp.]
MTIQINDPWFESLYTKEFGANTTKFVDEIKVLLVERYQKEKRILALLHQYQDANISIGKIAENLYIDREEVLALLRKHNIDFVDYSLEDEKKNIDDFLEEFKK